jgi:hypothetical protein
MAAYKKRTEGNVSNEKFAEIECEIECNIASAENVNNPIFIFSKVQDGAKTYIDKNYSKGIRIIYNGMWGTGTATGVIIPHIKDVQVIKDRVVIVSFADDSQEKAVLDSADTFSLEQGISICITKKMLSMGTNGNGSSAYNKLINHCLKVYENSRKAEEKAKAEEQAVKEKEKKAADKARAKRIKKANKNREREIEIQKEAYLRAMREFGGNSAVNE